MQQIENRKLLRAFCYLCQRPTSRYRVCLRVLECVNEIIDDGEVTYSLLQHVTQLILSFHVIPVSVNRKSERVLAKFTGVVRLPAMQIMGLFKGQLVVDEIDGIRVGHRHQEVMQRFRVIEGNPFPLGWHLRTRIRRADLSNRSIVVFRTRGGGLVLIPIGIRSVIGLTEPPEHRVGRVRIPAPLPLDQRIGCPYPRLRFRRHHSENGAILGHRTDRSEPASTDLCQLLCLGPGNAGLGVPQFELRMGYQYGPKPDDFRVDRNDAIFC